MKLSAFKFDIPSSIIALHPMENRDESRLMVIHKDTGKFEHKTFKDLVSYFNEDDVLVLNDTKVFPARLYGNKEKTGAKIEVFLLRKALLISPSVTEPINFFHYQQSLHLDQK